MIWDEQSVIIKKGTRVMYSKYSGEELDYTPVGETKAIKLRDILYDSISAVL